MQDTRFAIENRQGVIEIDTPRLKIRQWLPRDYAPFAQIAADPAVMEFFPALLTRDESDTMVERMRALIIEHGWGFWAVEKKDTGQWIGLTGLNTPHSDLPCMPCVEIGWRYAKHAWGQGYATEAANASLFAAFEYLDLEAVVAFTAVDNQRSRAVMERLGMINTGQNFDHPQVPADSPLCEHVLYKISRGRWRQLNTNLY